MIRGEKIAVHVNLKKEEEKGTRIHTHILR